ncbi:kinesin family member C1 [Pseudoscourfieldia marina]
MESRIPKPTTKTNALAVLDDNIVPASKVPSNKRKIKDAPQVDIGPAKSVKRSTSNVSFTPAAPSGQNNGGGNAAATADSGATWEDLCNDGWTHDALIEHKLQGFKKFDHKGKFDAALAHLRRMRVGYKHALEEEAVARADVQEANEKADHELAEKQKEYDELNGRLNDKAKDCATLKEEKAALQSNVVALEVDKAGLQESLAEMTGQRDDAKSEAAELSKDLARSNDDVAKFKEECGKLNEKVEQAQVYGQSLQESNAKLMKDNAESAAQVQNMLTEKAKLAEELGELKGSYTAVSMQLDNATNKTIPELEANKASLTAELSNANASNAELSSAKATLTAEVAGLKTALDDSNDKARRLDGEVQNLGAAKAQLEGDLASACKTRDETSATLATVRTEHANTSAELAQTSAKLASTSAELAETTASLAATSENLSNRTEECATLTDKVGKLSSEVSETNAQLTQLTAQHETVCAEKEQVSTKLSASETECASLTTQVEKLTGEVNDTTTKLTELLAQHDAVCSEKQEACTKLSASETECATLTEKVGKLSSEVSETTTKLTELSAQHDAVCSEKQEACTKLTATEAELNSTKSQMALVERERASLEERSRSLDAQLTAKGQECAELSSRADFEHAEVERLRAATAEYERIAATSQTDASSLQARAMALAKSLSEAERRVAEGEMIRRRLHNTIMELKGNVRVFCRARPLSSDEMETDDAANEALQMTESSDELALMTAGAQSAMGRGAREERHLFTFDKVFSPSTNQSAIFTEISQLVQSALDGYNVCIFAYGQTGSGKTYTMVGGEGEEHQGIIPRSLAQIFQHAKKLEQEMGWSFDMQAQLLEVYNEEVRDLLGAKKETVAADFSMTANANAAGPSLSIKHDAQGNTTIGDAALVPVSDSAQVQKLLDRANARRTTASTSMNERSSRSHCIFRLIIKGKQMSDDGTMGDGREIKGVLNLVDLAGSERLAKTQAKGDRLKEAQHINKSLSALGDVISSIASKKAGSKKADAHVPYRNSKLTYLLQPCLSGDAKTLMFVNVSPSAASSHETLCSLRFASKVNQCETR